MVFFSFCTSAVVLLCINIPFTIFLMCWALLCIFFPSNKKCCVMRRYTKCNLAVRLADGWLLNAHENFNLHLLKPIVSRMTCGATGSHAIVYMRYIGQWIEICLVISCVGVVWILYSIIMRTILHGHESVSLVLWVAMYPSQRLWAVGLSTLVPLLHLC